MAVSYTRRQGQYLAYIHGYTRLHRRPPSEAEMAAYFGVSPPSVHQMIVTLERRRLIQRTPGQARSVRVLLPPESIPDVEANDETMTDRQTLLPRFQRAITVHDSDYGIRTALEEMHKGDYSQAVVRVKGRLRLLTHDGLGRLMADAWNDDVVSLKHTGIDDALQYEAPGTMVVMAADRTVAEAREVFTRPAAPRVCAIVVTDTGDDQGQPLGIVTRWDLFGP